MPVGIIGVGAVREPAAQFDRPPQVVRRDGLRCLLPHDVAPAEAGDHPVGALGPRGGEQVRLIAVEEAEQAGAHLAHMVLGDAVQLACQVVVVALLGQADGVADFAAGEAAVRVAHRLVPDELDAVAVADDPIGKVGSADRRPVRTDEVLRPQ